MLETVCRQTECFIEQMPKAARKEYGQFFTSMETARYMASLFSLPKDRADLYILDAGAGSGILSVALVEQACKVLGRGTVLHLTCYENDPHILPLLQANMDLAKRESALTLEVEIITENYITSQSEDFSHALFSDGMHREYDLIIGNPPYKKIVKDAPEARAMQEVCYGAPNLYFLFAAMGIFNLKSDAQMVYIIPRSWTSGAYFEGFRKYLFKHCVLTHIHLFVSRDKVFDKENVLQETMIVRLQKTSSAPADIVVTTTQSNHDFSDITSISVPYNIVVSGKNQYVHLITSEEEKQAIEALNHFGYTLPELGLKMKTGLVVDFRAADLLRDKQEADTIPLIYSRHIKDGRVRFPQGEDSEYILKDRDGLRQTNKNYLFVKRFTAKEESRRLQCGIYLKRYLPDYPYISSQNKVNFIDGMQEMSECIVYGLYVIFNSTLYDTYYRILNGSTQVNSTEVNNMPMPSMDIIESMGKQLIAKRQLTVAGCNEILNSYLS